MTVDDIVNAYCSKRNLQIMRGSKHDNDPAPILPFLIADCAYQEFCSGVKPLHLKQNLKVLKNRWLDDYRQFNTRLFSCLDEDQRDFAIDIMDAYSDFIQNDVMMMRVALMNLVKGCEFEDQKIIASLMLCNIFSQVAQICFGCVFVNSHGRSERASELDRMRNISHKMANAAVSQPETINPNVDKGLNAAVDAYMKKTTNWLKNYDRKISDGV